MDVVERGQLSTGQAAGHWYYRAKFELLLSRLKSAGCLRPETRIADVGCGVGLFLTFLEKLGRIAPAQLLGIDSAYSAPATASGGGAAILPAWPDGKTVDAALLMDVLEHTPDDLAVLRETAGHVENGGHVFITVPAFSWMFSAHDRFLGHFRRYTRNGLRRLIQRCGDLEIVESHYFYASIFPAAALWRLARKSRGARVCSDLMELPRWLNALLRAISRAELRWASKNRVAGLSVVALCRKTAPATARTAAAA